MMNIDQIKNSEEKSEKPVGSKRILSKQNNNSYMYVQQEADRLKKKYQKEFSTANMSKA